jgi:hypothetical protein
MHGAKDQGKLAPVSRDTGMLRHGESAVAEHIRVPMRFNVQHAELKCICVEANPRGRPLAGSSPLFDIPFFFSFLPKNCS